MEVVKVLTRNLLTSAANFKPEFDRKEHWEQYLYKNVPLVSFWNDLTLVGKKWNCDLDLKKLPSTRTLRQPFLRLLPQYSTRRTLLLLRDTYWEHCPTKQIYLKTWKKAKTVRSNHRELLLYLLGSFKSKPTWHNQPRFPGLCN